MSKSVGQAPTAGEQTQQKTVSDVFRHRSGTGKSYCRTRFNVGSERVKGLPRPTSVLPHQQLYGLVMSHTSAPYCHTRHSNTQLWQLFAAVPNVRTAFLPTAWYQTMALHQISTLAFPHPHPYLLVKHSGGWLPCCRCFSTSCQTSS
jgi:hypothetical protein